MLEDVKKKAKEVKDDVEDKAKEIKNNYLKN